MWHPMCHVTRCWLCCCKLLGSCLLRGVSQRLRHGANVHGDQDCALRCAAAEGHDLVVDLLLRAGADVHAHDDSSLLTAVSRGHAMIVKRLLQAGADVTALDQDAICVAAGNRIWMGSDVFWTHLGTSV